MAFVPPAGTRRATSAKTRQQIGQNNILLNLMDRSLEPDMQSMERVYAQRRTYSSTTPGTVNRSSAADAAANTSRTWQTPKTVTGTEITVSLRQGEELAVALPRLDVIQSPLQEIENTRRTVAQGISDGIESDLANTFLGFDDSGGSTANGNAGQVSRATLGKAGTNFIDPPTAGSYANAGNTDGADLVLDAIDDFILWAKDKNLVDGRAVYGDFPATLYMCLPAYLFKYYVANQLRDKGYSLDPLTDDVLRRSSVFSSAAFAGRLGLPNLTIITPNAVPDATTGNAWQFWGGYTEAVVGGIGPILTQLISPEQNQSADGWVVRQVVNPFYNLLNGDGIRLYTIHQK